MDDDSRKNYIIYDNFDSESQTDDQEYFDEEEANEIFNNIIYDISVNINFDIKEYLSKNTLPIAEFLTRNDIEYFVSTLI